MGPSNGGGDCRSAGRSGIGRCLRVGIRWALASRAPRTVMKRRTTNGSRTPVPLVDLSGHTLAEVVELLDDSQRARAATHRLMAAGREGVMALRTGLHHENAAIRAGCCKVLDHFMDEAAIPEIVANIEHPDPTVRSWALHALACDRCKEGTCAPDSKQIVPMVLTALKNDPSPAVRARAVGLLAGRRDDREVRAALFAAMENDSNANVRKVAGRCLLGGGRLKHIRRAGPRSGRRARSTSL